jgi:hypothetical protein
VNRSIWEKVAEAKDVCKAKSLDMDVADLRLQNLQYEKNHLVRQIRHCRDFHFDESTVQLVDEATFAKTAPAELRTPGQPHEHLVNRMSHELQQRQALCAQRDTLLAEKARRDQPYPLPLPPSPSPTPYPLPPTPYPLPPTPYPYSYLYPYPYPYP